MSTIRPRVTGDTWRFRLGPIKRDTIIVDLTGAGIVATITSALTQADPGEAQVTEVSSTSGVATATVATGVIDIRFEKLVTGLPVSDDYWIDVKVTESDGSLTTFGPTKFKVTQN